MCIRDSQLDETVALVERAGGRAAAHAADVTDAEAMDGAVQAAEKRFGPLTLLVNNAGVSGPIEPLWEADLDAWWRCLEVHLKGAAIGAKAALPGMVARRQGRIVNVTSSIAARPTPYLSAYGIAKAALLRLTDSLAAETREHGIGVFALDPGGVRTSLIDDHLLAAPWAVRALPFLESVSPEARGALWTTPPELPGRLCVRIASGAADALTGRVIGVRQDLDSLLRDADTILQADLYTLRLRTELPADSPRSTDAGVRG
jgi:NAD(P)-dependent dehydrogenase (short-subunit alcohol dehydrogenase family)